MEQLKKKGMPSSSFFSPEAYSLEGPNKEAVVVSTSAAKSSLAEAKAENLNDQVRYLN
jgi:hypothetical protein